MPGIVTRNEMNACYRQRRKIDDLRERLRDAMNVVESLGCQNVSEAIAYLDSLEQGFKNAIDDFRDRSTAPDATILDVGTFLTQRRRVETEANTRANNHERDHQH